MHLYYQVFPENQDIDAADEAPVVIIPGLFGSTANWRSFARELSKTRPVIVIDQRNHGRSPHEESHQYQDMVSDLLEMVDYWGFDKIVPCGHSMGGKTAMLFALAYPERVEQLLVLDIAPKRYHHSHAPFLDALMGIDVTQLKSRSEADKALRTAIPDTGTRLFLLQSLAGKAGAYYWRINLAVLHAAMSEITDFPLNPWPKEPIEMQARLIYGQRSEYVLEQDHDSFRELFSDVSLSAIAGAGHWLHVEQSRAVLDAVIDAIQ